MTDLKNSIKWAAGVALGAVIALTGAQALGAFGDGQAQGPGPGPGRMGPRRGGLMGPGGPGLLTPRIDTLTDEQREQIRGVIESHQNEMRPLMEQLHTVRTALHDAITSGTVDEAAIRQKSQEAGAAETELNLLRARIHSQILALLTPEQRAEIEKRQAEMKQRMSERPRRGPRRPR